MAEDPSPQDPTGQFHDVADWMTEDVSQRLYAARQDLADAAAERPADAAEIEAVRERLMAIVRTIHVTAAVLRAHDAATMPLERVTELAARVERDCLDAEAVMARGLSLIAPPAGAPVARRLPAREAVRGDGPLADWAGRRLSGPGAVNGLG